MINETEREAYQKWKSAAEPYGFNGFTAFQAGAAYQREQNAYRLAVDTGLVCAHIGVTNPEDAYETARKKLNDLICWSIQVDRDLGREHVKGLVEANK